MRDYTSTPDAAEAAAWCDTYPEPPDRPGRAELVEDDLGREFDPDSPLAQALQRAYQRVQGEWTPEREARVLDVVRGAVCDVCQRNEAGEHGLCGACGEGRAGHNSISPLAAVVTRSVAAASGPPEQPEARPTSTARPRFTNERNPTVSTTTEDEALAKIRAALADPNASIRLVHTFTHGRAAQVYVKSRKVGPLLIPDDDQSLADVLQMLGSLAEETTEAGAQ